MEEQHYNCAICRTRLLREEFLPDMLVLVSRYLCEKSIYAIFENFWSAQPTNDGWLATTSERNETRTALGIFRDSAKCGFCARERITKCIMVLNIRSHNTVVSQSAPTADHHCLRKAQTLWLVWFQELFHQYSPSFVFFFFNLHRFPFSPFKDQGIMEAEGYKSAATHLLTCPGDHGNDDGGDGAVAHSPSALPPPQPHSFGP